MFHRQVAALIALLLTTTLGAQLPAAVVTLKEGKTSLFDADGSALVIHAGPDDYLTDPTGNAGARIACGVVTK